MTPKAEKIDDTKQLEEKLGVATRQIEELKDAIGYKLDGKFIWEYLLIQFPAVDGHIPLIEYFRRLKEVLTSVSGERYIRAEIVENLIKEMNKLGRLQPSRALQQAQEALNERE